MIILNQLSLKNDMFALYIYFLMFLVHHLCSKVILCLLIKLEKKGRFIILSLVFTNICLGILLVLYFLLRYYELLSTF